MRPTIQSSPTTRARLANLAARLPAPDAIRALADLGFTTIVLEPRHNRRHLKMRRMMAFERASVAGHGLGRVHITPERIAYALRPETLPAPE